jgi:multidrug efflux system membrane fusion protein
MPGATADAPVAGRSFGGGPPGGRGRGAGLPPQPVTVAPVTRRDIRVQVDAVGVIQAMDLAVVRPQVSGVLRALHFREGQPVQRGQLLASIDPRAFEASLAQAEGVLARDRAQLEAARADLARYRGLLAQDAAPAQQVDTQQALVRQLEGTVQADEGAVANARLQLSYTQVTAPIDGRAGLKQADVGNVVTPGDANGIVSVAQTHPVALSFGVPARHLPLIRQQLRSGQALAVSAWDRGGGTRLAQGRVAAIDNAIDPATDTIKVKALFDNRDDALYPNQAVGATVLLQTLHDVLAVPQAALLRGAQGFYVFVVGSDGRVAARSVQPGASDGDWVAVQGDLQPGQHVVVDGTDRLREGSAVQPVTAAAASPGAAASGAGRRPPPR